MYNVYVMDMTKCIIFYLKCVYTHLVSMSERHCVLTDALLIGCLQVTSYQPTGPFSPGRPRLFNV